jgi:hypothetical protein
MEDWRFPPRNLILRTRQVCASAFTHGPSLYWDIARVRLLDGYRRFRISLHSRNVCKQLPIYAEEHPRRAKASTLYDFEKYWLTFLMMEATWYYIKRRWNSTRLHGVTFLINSYIIYLCYGSINDAQSCAIDDNIWIVSFGLRIWKRWMWCRGEQKRQDPHYVQRTRLTFMYILLNVWKGKYGDKNC